MRGRSSYPRFSHRIVRKHQVRSPGSDCGQKIVDVGTSKVTQRYVDACARIAPRAHYHESSKRSRLRQELIGVCGLTSYLGDFIKWDVSLWPSARIHCEALVVPRDPISHPKKNNVRSEQCPDQRDRPEEVPLRLLYGYEGQEDRNHSNDDALTCVRCYGSS